MERTFLQQSWHFEPLTSDDIFMTKLQLSLDVASKYLLGLLSYYFEVDILATKLTLCASPLWWHFHYKVTTFLVCCFQAFARSIVLLFWGGHSCNKVDTLCLSSLMTFSLQSYNFPWMSLLRNVVSWKCHHMYKREAQSVNFVARMFTPKWFT